MPHSGRHFLRFGRDLMPKSSILGAPWRSAGTKMAPKIAQVVQKTHQKSISRWHLFAALLPRSLSERSWAPFLRIFNGFGMNFDRYVLNCWCISEAFFAIIFADCQRRPTRSELAANIKNIQISAETCKIQTQTTNADTKTLIDNLQFAECNQLHQTPIVKNGGRR